MRSMTGRKIKLFGALFGGGERGDGGQENGERARAFGELGRPG